MNPRTNPILWAKYPLQFTALVENVQYKKYLVHTVQYFSNHIRKVSKSFGRRINYLLIRAVVTLLVVPHSNVQHVVLK